jgi:predicted lipoprotein with Yx(FWY)xxD motif
MKRLTPLIVISGLAAVAALVIAVSSGGASNTKNSAPQTGGPYGAKAAAPAPAAASSAIDVRPTPLGKILVDANGRALYLFEADKPNMSNCSGPCLSLWPAFTANAKPKAEGGAVAAKIGTISAGAEKQVTYNGHPLYYYAADQEPGDTIGEGLDQFGAVWDVLAPSGNGIDND